MDGVLNRPLLLMADLPGEEGVQVFLENPLGIPVLANSVAEQLSDERWLVTVSGEMVSIPGLWRVEFRGERLGVEFDVMVGSPSPLAVPLWDVVCQIASHYAEVVEGRVASSTSTEVTVPTLAFGAGHWKGRYLVIHPEDDLANGLVDRRVTDNDAGGVLSVISPYPATPVEGARCALLPIPVSEIMRVLRVAVAEFGRLARLVVTAEGLSVDDGEVQIPRGFTHISAVWADGERLPDSVWTPVPRRRLRVDADTSEVTLQGLMPLVAPALPIGWIDCEVTTLFAHAGMHLHSARARGAGLDVEEHLRRMVALGQLAEGNVSRLASRVPHGTREVIP